MSLANLLSSLEMNGRRMEVSVLYNKKDISTELNKYLKSVSYTDVISGAADDLQLTLEDIPGLWQGAWMPDRGAILKATLIQKYWSGSVLSTVPGVETLSLPLGLFEIDEIESKGPPSEVTIKAVSVPDNTSLRGVDRTRSWEKTELKVIANDIAKEAGLELYYDTDDSPVLDRAEQTEQSDLSFLLQLCNNAGLALKVAGGKLIIFDEAKLEAVAPTITIVKPGKVYTAVKSMTYLQNVISYSLKSKTRDIYASCRVEYTKAKKKEKISYTFKVPNKVGKMLRVNEQVDSVAAAERLAKKKLREKNREEVTASVNLLGNFSLAAGVTVKLLGFGAYDGNCIITRAAHSIGSGYATQIDLRRCLDGY